LSVLHSVYAQGVGKVQEKKAVLNSEETLDDLILGKMKLIQPAQGYRFSLDAVLLAHFPILAGVKQAVDLGTGSGIITILLAARDSALRIRGIEIQEDMVDRARRSIQFNRLEDRIEIISADIREMNKYLPGGEAELVLSNPPFWKNGEGYVNSNKEEAIARHELKLNLEELVSQGAYLLCGGGRMAIIHRADRLEEIIGIFTDHKLYPRRLRMVHPFIDRNAKLILLEGQKGRPGSLSVLPPLIIYERPGEYCEEIKKIYREK